MPNMLSLITRVCLLSIMLVSTVVWAGDAAGDNSELDEWSDDWDWGDDWGEEEISPWQFSGFTEAAYGVFLQDNNLTTDQSLREVRARFEWQYNHDLFELSAKADAIYDNVLSASLLQTRELNVALSPLDSLDLKIGRQVLTWGTGDYLFLNDLFAKDWQAFFAGRDDEYLKAPSDSLRISWYLADLTLELAWTKDFTPDKYLNGERFGFYSPQQQQIIAPEDGLAVTKTSQAQWAGRIATNINGVEYALYAYQGFWPTPQGINPQGQGYFPELRTWGGSVRLPFAKGLLNSEFSVYQSEEDRRGRNPNIANDQFRFLLGYERELIKNMTLGVQYYLERTRDYDAFVGNSANPAELVDENRQLLTVRLRYAVLQQKLIYSLFTFYSPTDADAYFRPSLSYRVNDNWSYSVGANLFLGKHEYSFFAQHEDNSNIWLRARYQF